MAFSLSKFGHYLKLPSQDICNLEKIGLLHDIGKLNVDSYILNKKEKLTNKEWLVIKSHSLIGYDILEREKFDPIITKSVLEHHENFDGTGYPCKVKGKDISLYGRMVRIVDSFDVMTTNRSYSNAKSMQDALNEILKCSNELYDPVLTELFVGMKNRLGTTNIKLNI